MAAIPISKRETSYNNPYLPEIMQGLCFANTEYDGVLRDTGKEPMRFKPLYGNLPACVHDCLKWQETLLKFGIKHQDIMLLHNPNFKEWVSTV